MILTPEDLAATVAALMPGVRADLERLVRIPSVGFPGYDPANVRESARVTAEILEAAGYEGVRLIEVTDGHPAVYGEARGPEGAPTVLLYAHHDVQPEGPLERWTSPPYEPAEREGRLFGRGTCDDKCGIMMHAAALLAFGGRPPVNVKVLVEGEEECTSEHLDELVGGNVDLLRADVAVIADSGLYEKGRPALTTSIRGAVDCIVEVRTLDEAVHSGQFGGPIPDAIMSLARMITSLHDDRGRVTIEGLKRGSVVGAPPLDRSSVWAEAGVRPGVERLGEGDIGSQLWQGPSISVIGLDVPSVQEASWQLVPVARAAITMRIAPGDDPAIALKALTEHLRANVPWGAEATITPGSAAAGYETDPQGRFHRAHTMAFADAWGVDAMNMGEGGSVPLVSVLAREIPGIEILMTGPGDELCGAHSVDESVDLGEFERACLAEALFLQNAAAER